MPRNKIHVFKVPKVSLFEMVHRTMLMICRAKADLDSGIVVVGTWDEVCRALDNKQLLLAPFCGGIPCEELFKKESARLLPPPFRLITYTELLRTMCVSISL